MASAKKRGDKSSTEGALPSLGELLSEISDLAPPPPAGKPPSEASPPPESRPLPKKKAPLMERVILRRSRKGRGGHVVTLVETRGFGGSKADLAKKMARALGCGSRLEDDLIVLQGDQVDRAETWLKGQGVTRIARGG